MADRKVPTTKGTKVTLGENAPAYQESTGAIKPSSLAAESAAHDGGFAENRDVDPKSAGTENMPSKTSKGLAKDSKDSKDKESSKDSSDKSHHKPAKPARTENAPRDDHAQDASHEHHPHDGPHGKNLHEGIDEADLRKSKPVDPTLAAERQFEQTQLGGGAAGGKKFHAGEKTAFDSLGDAQA